MTNKGATPNMRIGRLVQAASITGAALFMLAANASATSITFNTNSAGTMFSSGGLSLSQSSGEAATLSFVADPNTATGVPSGINFGNFTLACATCTTIAGGNGANFGAFTFDVVVTDVTDGGATGTFVGTSSGGSVFLDQSTIQIVWSPAQLGTGTNNATSGNFGPTNFTITPFSIIVNPTSGAQPGSTTLQGTVNSSAVPEPMTSTFVGAGLVALGLLGRKKVAFRS
jgi:hypothetical protein